MQGHLNDHENLPANCNSYPTNLTDLLPLTPGPEHDKDPNKEDLQDEWHTNAMKAAIPQLRAFLKDCESID